MLVLRYLHGFIDGIPLDKYWREWIKSHVIRFISDGTCRPSQDPSSLSLAVQLKARYASSIPVQNAKAIWLQWCLQRCWTLHEYSVVKMSANFVINVDTVLIVYDNRPCTLRFAHCYSQSLKFEAIWLNALPPPRSIPAFPTIFNPLLSESPPSPQWIRISLLPRSWRFASHTTLKYGLHSMTCLQLKI